MNAKAEQVSGVSALDIAKLTLAAILLAGGIFAFYYFGEWTSATRILVLLAAFIAAVAVAAFSGPGRNVREYLRESQFELRKVVWPTRDETLRTTGVIIVVVIILSLLLGLIDLTLKWVILDWILKIGK